MRQVKFRGKRKDNGEWVYGYYIKDKNGECSIYTIIATFDTSYCNVFIEVIPETIGQFTGLTDKNGRGKDVCDADIISSPNGCIYQVFWNQAKGQWYVRLVNSKTKPKQTLCELLKNSFYEVIGNIHDNPELLEK